jgi:hypothetical protein
VQALASLSGSGEASVMDRIQQTIGIDVQTV